MNTQYAETSAFVSHAKPQGNEIVCPRCKEYRETTKQILPERLRRGSKTARMAKVGFSQLSQDYLMRKL